jgi:hypothetical protein
VTVALAFQSITAARVRTMVVLLIGTEETSDFIPYRSRRTCSGSLSSRGPIDRVPQEVVNRPGQ